MARGAVKAKQAQNLKNAKAQGRGAGSAKAQPRGRKRHASGGNPNQQLFFSRMRRRAKPMYVILAVLFAITFAGLGIGSGSNGGLDQLFANLNIFGSHGSSVSKALNEVKKHPTVAKSFRDLATAYEAKGDQAGAIGALQEYTTLKPKDAAAFSELGGLQLSQGQSLATDYQNAVANEQLAAPSQGFKPTGKFGTAIGTNPIEQAQATTLSATTTDLYQRATVAFGDAVGSYKKLVALHPADASAQFQLATAAQTAGDNTSAIAAYKAYVKLDPSSSTAAQVKQLITKLQAQSAPTTTTPATKTPAKKK
jgi:DNA-binding SARP family transcriptional activator